MVQVILSHFIPLFNAHDIKDDSFIGGTHSIHTQNNECIVIKVKNKINTSPYYKKHEQLMAKNKIISSNKPIKQFYS